MLFAHVRRLSGVEMQSARGAGRTPCMRSSFQLPSGARNRDKLAVFSSLGIWAESPEVWFADRRVPNGTGRRRRASRAARWLRLTHST